jgi:hypothetical protein
LTQIEHPITIGCLKKPDQRASVKGRTDHHELREFRREMVLPEHFRRAKERQSAAPSVPVASFVSKREERVQQGVVVRTLWTVRFAE